MFLKYIGVFFNSNAIFYMSSFRRRNNRSSLDKVNLDKKVDQFIEVGRQFVDGVSGARPGNRKRKNFQDFSRRNIRNVSNWMNSKVDAFFEDDDLNNWGDDSFKEDVEFKSFSRRNNQINNQIKRNKKPLQAISMRIEDNKANAEQKRLTSSQHDIDDEWVEDSFFQINKWQRTTEDDHKREYTFQRNHDNDRIITRRNLPRSRRRRI